MKLPNLLNRPVSDVKVVDPVTVYGVGCVTDEKSKALDLPLVIDGELTLYDFDDCRVVNI